MKNVKIYNVLPHIRGEFKGVKNWLLILQTLIGHCKKWKMCLVSNMKQNFLPEMAQWLYFDKTKMSGNRSLFFLIPTFKTAEAYIQNRTKSASQNSLEVRG